MDDDGNQIKGGPEQVTYIDEKGMHISPEKAVKMIQSGKYVDDRTLYSRRAAKRYQKVPPKPQTKRPVEYVPPNPNQANELIASMNEIFSKARSNIKEMTDLQMIEEDAVSGYTTQRKKSSSRKDRSYRNHYESENPIKSSRSRSQMVNSQDQESRSRPQKTKQYATGYNPYTGQYYQYEVPNYNQREQQQPADPPSHDSYQQSSSSSRKKSKEEKAAELDAKIARLQAKLAKSTVGSSSSRARSMHPRIERGEHPASPKMVSPTPPTVTIDNTTMEYRMHHYSGIEDPRTNLLKAEMLGKQNRERIRLEQAYNQVLEERYNQRRIQSVESLKL